MADDTSELDEIVQVACWPSSGSTPAANINTISSTPSTKTTATNQNSSSNSGVGITKMACTNNNNNQSFDDSTANGFTTAPATSDDDYESDDDDDSRSNYSNNNIGNSNSMISNSSTSRHSKHGDKQNLAKGEERRSHHNVLERKRRDLLKDSFARLRDSVPTTQPRDRVSRAEILKQAADFIQSTVQRNLNVRAELDALIKKNRELEELKQRKTTSDGSSKTVPPSEPKKLLVNGGGSEMVMKQE